MLAAHALAACCWLICFLLVRLMSASRIVLRTLWQTLSPPQGKTEHMSWLLLFRVSAVSGVMCYNTVKP